MSNEQTTGAAMDPNDDRQVAAPAGLTGLAPLVQAHLTLVARYLRLLEVLPDRPDTVPQCQASHLAWMCRTMLSDGASWPIDKLARWVGFVQGVMAMREWVEVEAERDMSRPLFHEAYAQLGVPAPATVAPSGPSPVAGTAGAGGKDPAAGKDRLSPRAQLVVAWSATAASAMALAAVLWSYMQGGMP